MIHGVQICRSDCHICRGYLCYWAWMFCSGCNDVVQNQGKMPAPSACSNQEVLRQLDSQQPLCLYHAHQAKGFHPSSVTTPCPSPCSLKACRIYHTPLIFALRYFHSPPSVSHSYISRP